MQTITRSVRMGMFLVFAALTGSAQAGTFNDGIVIDNNFTDWLAVPVLEVDPNDNAIPTGIDYATVQVANDDDFLYLHVTYHQPIAVGTFLALDNDSNTATGYDIAALGVIGSEAGWQNDFPFDQRTGFNVGTLDNGAAMLAPQWDVDAIEKEYAISRSATFASDSAPVFPNDSFTLLFWSTDSPAGFDFTEPIPYAFATSPISAAVPEPSSFAGMVVLGLLGLLAFRNRRRSAS